MALGLVESMEIREDAKSRTPTFMGLYSLLKANHKRLTLKRERKGIKAIPPSSE